MERAVEEIKKNNYKTVLDIGTGSGAIAIAIKKETDIVVTALDISTSALDVARKNAERYNLDINFIHSDLFQNVKDKYDMIVSNPPYIDYNDINNIDRIVYQNEPHLALFSNDFGLYYYKKIIDEIPNYLNDNGLLIMEIGEKQASDIKEYLNSVGSYDLEVIKDYNKLDRVVVIKRK